MKRHVKRHAVVQPLDQSYRFIPLTQGQNAIVDAKNFEWLNQWNWCATWCKSTKSFYAVRQSPRKSNKIRKLIYMHRVILGCSQKKEGDHKNRNTLDMRKRNLRKCTRSQGQRNRGLQSNNTSGFRGVSWLRDRHLWEAKIRMPGKHIHLGKFLSAKEAAHAYDKAAKKYHGEFACLNFPTQNSEPKS